MSSKTKKWKQRRVRHDKIKNFEENLDVEFDWESEQNSYNGAGKKWKSNTFKKVSKKKY